MKTPPDPPFDPDDPNFDPWADDPDAPKEPGLTDELDDDSDIPWDEDDAQGDEEPTPTPVMTPGTVRGPAALLDSELRGEIEFEILFQQTRAVMGGPPARPAPGRLFAWAAVALAVLALAAAADGPGAFAFVVGAVLVHELGHYLAMRAFRYREPKVFLLPFYWGGRLQPAAVGQRAVTILAGPLPGLVVAALLSAVGWAEPLARVLLIVNAFLLLPAVPLDGGQLLELLGLGRRPWPGTVLRAAAVATAVGLIFWAEPLELQIFLGTFAVMTVAATPMVHRHARSRQALVASFPGVPAALADLGKPELRRLFEIALVLTKGDYEPQQLAAIVRDLHAQAATPVATPRVAAVMLGLYLLAWGLAVVAFLLLRGK